MMRIKASNPESGFTMIELLFGVAMMSILCGGVVLCLGTAEKSFRRAEITNALEQQLRSAQELMSQDISQAGLTGTGYTTSTAYQSLTGNDNPSPLATLTLATTTATTTATVSSTAGMFAGQMVFVGTGANQESVFVSTVASTTTFTTGFGKAHAANDPIFPHGVFNDGVVPLNTTTGYTTTGSTVNKLRLYGDIAGNGMITVVEYVCPTASTTPSYTDTSGTVWAPLMRYEYDNALTQGSSPVATSSVAVLDMVAVTPNGCFTLTQATQAVNATSGDDSPTFVTAVSVTIRAMAGVRSNDGTALTPLYDPDMHQPISVTRSFLNIQPRNINAAYNYAVYCNTKSLADGELMLMPTAIQTVMGAIQ